MKKKGKVNTRVLTEHGEVVFSLLCMGNRIISGAMDNKIKIWNFSEMKCEKTFNNHTDYVCHLIKFTDEVFLSCGVDGKVCAYNIKNLSFEKEVFVKAPPPEFCRMLKVSDDEFILVENGRGSKGESVSEDPFKFLSYSKGKVVRNSLLPKKLDVHFETKVLPSKKFENSIYVNCGEEDMYQTLLIDYVKGLISKKFTCNNSVVNTLHVMKVYDDEILLTLGEDKAIFFYNTSQGENPKHFKKIDSKFTVLSSYLFTDRKNGLLVFGDEISGTVGILDLKKVDMSETSAGHQGKKKDERAHELIDFEVVHKKGIFDIKLLCISKPEKTLNFVTCSFDKSVQLLSLTDVFVADLEEEDLKERVGYLLNEFVVKMKEDEFDSRCFVNELVFWSERVLVFRTMFV